MREGREALPAKSYDLCSRTARIGCSFFILFIGGSFLILGIMQPRALIGAWVVIPAAPIGVSAILSLIRSVGQVLEVDRLEARLLRKGVEVWHFRWDEVRLIRIQGNATWDFVDGAGRVYPLIVMNLPATLTAELRAYLPEDVQVVSKRFELFHRGDRPVYPLAIALLLPGLVALFWGGAGVLTAIRVLRYGANGEISLNTLLWQGGALVVGVFMVALGGSELARKPEKPRTLGEREVSLKRFLTGKQPLALPDGKSVWRLRPGREKHRLVEGVTIGIGLAFWGTLSVFVVLGAIRDFRTWPLLVMYALILGFYLFGLYMWLLELDPKGVTLYLDGGSFRAELAGRSYSAKRTKVCGSPALEVRIDGRSKIIDPEDFWEVEGMG